MIDAKKEVIKTRAIEYLVFGDALITCKALVS